MLMIQALSRVGLSYFLARLAAKNLNSINKILFSCEPRLYNLLLDLKALSDRLQ